MPEQRSILDTAAFLDSPEAAALTDVPAAARRAIVERYLACAYDEIGKAPHLLDGQDVHSIVGHLLPGRFARKDPAAPHLLPVLRALYEFLSGRWVMSQLYEIRRALDETTPEFEQAVRTGTAAHHAALPPQKPFVHSVEQTGRNDPCPCGSGKKFKKCCAKLGT